MGNIKTPTALLLMALMFIGGAPLSAGGIKVTTFAIVFIFVLNAICKENTVSLFNREISDKYIKLSIVTITISIIFIFAITFY